MKLYEMLAAFQRQGRICALILRTPADLAALTVSGGDTARLLVSEPDNDQQAVEICDALVRSGVVDLVVLGSPLVDETPLSWGEYSHQLARLRELSARHGCIVIFWGGDLS